MESSVAPAFYRRRLRDSDAFSDINVAADYILYVLTNWTFLVIESRHRGITVSILKLFVILKRIIIQKYMI